MDISSGPLFNPVHGMKRGQMSSPFSENMYPQDLVLVKIHSLLSWKEIWHLGPGVEMVSIWCRLCAGTVQRSHHDKT